MQLALGLAGTSLLLLFLAGLLLALRIRQDRVSLLLRSMLVVKLFGLLGLLEGRMLRAAGLLGSRVLSAGHALLAGQLFVAFRPGLAGELCPASRTIAWHVVGLLGSAF
jgi:hypothetical protein